MESVTHETLEENKVERSITGEVINLQFETEAQFEEWQENVANKQGIWCLKKNYNKVNPEREELLAKGRFLKNSQTFCCDRYGPPRKTKDKENRDENNEVIVKKRRKRGPSKKVQCKAHYCKKTFTNGQVDVIYHWQHINHDPLIDINAKSNKVNNKQCDQLDCEKLQSEYQTHIDNLVKASKRKIDEHNDNPIILKQVVNILKDAVEKINNLS